MGTIILFLVFICVFSWIMGAFYEEFQETRPRLQPLMSDFTTQQKRKKRPRLLRKIAFFNKPLVSGPLGQRMAKDLAMAQLEFSPEEFLLVKELMIVVLLALIVPLGGKDFITFNTLICFVAGYMIPEFWLKGKIKKVKNEIIKELPDTIDLLRLCVGAGLDFMLALKWIVEKSKYNKLINELNLVMQEINVGKPRRDALKDLASRYEIADLSTFTRTLIQADRMGTSVAEALEILSEDMRLSRFRRGEAMALKAPLKMLVPVLFFIFPVVAILVAAPIILDFLNTSALSNINAGIGK